jgi:hypothetical protein
MTTKHSFLETDLFPSSSEERKTSTLLGPLERAHVRKPSDFEEIKHSVYLISKEIRTSCLKPDREIICMEFLSVVFLNFKIICMLK